MRLPGSAALIESLRVTRSGSLAKVRNANVTLGRVVIDLLMGCSGKALLSGWLRAAAAVLVALVAAAAPAQASVAPDAGSAASTEPALAGLMAMAALAAMWWRLLARSDE